MKILYFAIIREWLKCGEEEFHLGSATTISDFVKKRIEPRLNGRKIDGFLFAVNENLVDGNHLLNNEDVLAILPPLSGGASQFAFR